MRSRAAARRSTACRSRPPPRRSGARSPGRAGWGAQNGRGGPAKARPGLIRLRRRPSRPLAARVEHAPVLIDERARAAANGAHVIVVRGVALALRIRELRGVIGLARLIGGVDAPL